MKPYVHLAPPSWKQPLSSSARRVPNNSQLVPNNNNGSATTAPDEPNNGSATTAPDEPLSAAIECVRDFFVSLDRARDVIDDATGHGTGTGAGAGFSSGAFDATFDASGQANEFVGVQEVRLVLEQMRAPLQHEEQEALLEALLGQAHVDEQQYGEHHGDEVVVRVASLRTLLGFERRSEQDSGSNSGGNSGGNSRCTLYSGHHGHTLYSEQQSRKVEPVSLHNGPGGPGGPGRPGGGPGGPGVGGGDDISILQRQLLDFYQTHCPERVAEVSEALAKLQNPQFKVEATGTIAWLIEEMRTQAIPTAGGAAASSRAGPTTEYHNGSLEYEQEDGVLQYEQEDGMLQYEQEDGVLQYDSGATREYGDISDGGTSATGTSQTKVTVMQVIASRTQGMTPHNARALAARFIEQLGAMGQQTAEADLTEVLAELRVMSDMEWDEALRVAS
jgi:hypothetical protein